MIKLNAEKQLVATKRIRIPFFDIDMAGIVWHGHYLKYFELARSVLLDEIGYSYPEMIETAVVWPVIDTNIRYLQPLRLDQDIVVSACLKEWKIRLVIDYTVEDDAGVLYTRGRSIQAPVDAKTQKLQLGAPELLVESVEKCLKAHMKLVE